MKYIKIILIVVLGVALPFMILKISIEYDILWELVGTSLYLYPIYLPFLYGWFGIKVFKETDKIFLPIIIFNLFLVIVVFFLLKMIGNSGLNLATAAVASLLVRISIYSIPVSLIAAAIYKHKNIKDKSQKDENYSTDKTQE